MKLKKFFRLWKLYVTFQWKQFFNELPSSDDKSNGGVK